MPSLRLAHKPKPHKWQFEAIGTHWSIETPSPLGLDISNGVTKIITEFDCVYSRFRDNSLVSKIAKKPGEYEFPSNVTKMIHFYKELYDVTDGAVSPLVGNILSDAGYDKHYSLTPGTVHPAPEWESAMEWRRNRVITKQAVLLDFGAAGKGYLIDLIAEFFHKHKVETYVIDASGDIRVRGITETIGLENPFDTTMVIGTVPLKDASICGSAVNRRAWGDWHHVVDGRTAKPTEAIVATWAIAPTALMADGLATALFFARGQQLSQWDFSYVRLYRDGRIEHSTNFMGELFT